MRTWPGRAGARRRSVCGRATWSSSSDLYIRVVPRPHGRDRRRSFAPGAPELAFAMTMISTLPRSPELRPAPSRSSGGVREPLGAREAFQAGDDPDALFDVGLVRDLGEYVVGAVRRHRVAAARTFAGVIAAALLALLLLPRTYATEAKLLAQRSIVMPVLSNPRRNVPTEEDTPTRLASEAILNHTNLVAIINATGLVAHYRAHLSPLAWVRDGVLGWFSTAPTDAELVDRLVWALQNNMWVNVTEGTVTIGAMWADPQMAYRIVQTAQENFFEERHTEELALISESIRILEQHTSDVNGEIRSSLDSMAQVRGPASADPSPYAAVLRRAAPGRDAIAAQSRLETVRRTIADLEQFRNRRLAEMQATLADQRGTFGSAHPQIATTEQLIRGLSTDSPQLAQLRREEQDLLATLGRLGASPTLSSAPTGTDPFVAAAALRGLERLQRDSVLSERLQYARSRLKIAVGSYEDLLSRLDAARIELETARAAFKYKYGVIMPAEVPRTAVKPRPVLVLGGALVLAIVLAAFTAVGLDVTSGRVFHRWQVERSLRLPVLGEVPAL